MQVERRYDSDSDRLFLIYYALPPGLNANNWGVSHRSLDVNIKTAINKPVIIYRKNPSNPFHSKQAGNFVHPTPEEASAELGHPLKESDYYNWQEKYAIGRVRNVDRRDKGYAFTLEITDPEAKNILKSDKYAEGIPGWTSPQILTYPQVYPHEEQSGIHDHWVIGHVILTDRPAYGFEKASLAAKCLGPEQECLIKTKNASQQEIGFCIKQATTDLIDSLSSLKVKSSSSLVNMSDNNSTQSPSNTEQETVVTRTLSEQNPKQEPDVSTSHPPGSATDTEGNPEDERAKEQSEEEPTNANLPRTLEEAHQIIKQLQAKEEMYKSQLKETRGLNKRLEILENERRYFQVANIVPRDIYRSEDAHNKEVLRIIEKDLDKDLGFLKEFYAYKRESQLGKGAQEQLATIKAKSASSIVRHDVPEYNNDTAQTPQNNSSVIQKTFDLHRKMIGGL